MPVEPFDLRVRLVNIAARREEHQEAASELADETRRLVREAQREGMAMKEVARLLRIDRTTLYRTYLSAPAA